MIDPETQKNIGILMAEAPAPIRAFLLTKLAPTVEGLMKKHKLHIDQADVLERELLLLLLSINTPAEFTENLKNAGHLEGALLMAVLTDVNSEVFTTIDAEMRTEPKPVDASAGKPEPVMPVLAQKPMPLPVPVPGTPLADALKRAGAMPMTGGGSPMPAPPKPAALLEDHEEPHININGAKPAAKPLWNPPQPVASAAPTLLPHMPPAPPSAAPAAGAAPSASKPPIVKEYGADPYREPLDEK